MKKYFIVLFLLVGLSSYAQDKVIINDYWFKDYYIIHNKQLYHYDESTDEKKIIKDYKIEKDNFGFYYIMINKDIMSYIPNYPFGELSINEIDNRNYQLPYTDIGINKINSSSFLTEKSNSKLIEYKSENLLKRFVKEAESFYIYNKDVRPWAEGVDDFGENEYLDVYFNKEMNEVLILNGYIDFEKKYLFYDNNRIRTLNISNIDNNNKFSINVSLEDTVMFTKIKLPFSTTKVKIKIIDVYSGNKYNDTCVSAIIAMKDTDIIAVNIADIISKFK